MSSLMLERPKDNQTLLLSDTEPILSNTVCRAYISCNRTNLHAPWAVFGRGPCKANISVNAPTRSNATLKLQSLFSSGSRINKN